MTIQPLVNQQGLKQDVFIGSGENGNFDFTLKKNGVAQDISSLSVQLVIKSTLSSTTFIVSETAGTFITDGTDGQVRFDLSVLELQTAHRNAILTLYNKIDANNKRNIKNFKVQIVHPGT